MEAPTMWSFSIMCWGVKLKKHPGTVIAQSESAERMDDPCGMRLLYLV